LQLALPVTDTATVVYVGTREEVREAYVKQSCFIADFTQRIIQFIFHIYLLPGVAFKYARADKGE
jgi:hypothetical protein